MKTSKPRAIKPAGIVGDDDLLTQLQTCNLWDAVDLRDQFTSRDGPSMRLFGNRNIGNLHLCNMQVGNMMTSRDRFAIMNWYVRTNVPSFMDEYFENTYATLVIDQHPRWCSPMSVMRWNKSRALWPEIVEPLSTFSVQVDSFRGALADRFRATLVNEPALVWVHLEGLRIPDQLVSPDPDLDEARVRDRWHHLRAKIIRMITTKRSGHVDTAEHIARWVMSNADDPDLPNDVRAQLTALADAIHEGRWRPENTAQRAPSDADE